jgi:lysophospholipase L1-like esterase
LSLPQPPKESSTFYKDAKIPFKSKFRLDIPKEMRSQKVDLVIENYQNNLKKMHRFMAGGKGSMIISIQPMASLECKSIYAHCTEENMVWRRAMFDTYPRMIIAARQVADQCRLPFVDFHNHFIKLNNPCSFFFDSVHLNSKGQAMVAQKLLDSAKNELKKSASE